LNGHLFHAIVEFEGFAFEGMAFSRLALGHCWRCYNLLWDLFEPNCAEIPRRWSKDVPRFVGQFLFNSYPFGREHQFDDFVQN
jgi:hypothetical protein